MDEIYAAFHSSAADFIDDKALMMSPSDHHNLMMIPDMYSTTIYHNNNNNNNNLIHHHEVFSLLGGSSDTIDTFTKGFQSSGTSEAASITRDFQRGSLGIEEDDGDEGYPFIKAKIASHPSYPKLLNAYIDCRKVGAPAEIAYVLDEMRHENNLSSRRSIVTSSFGADPELDEFMETYCEILVKYKAEMSRPFDEATSFLTKIEAQLGNLCKDNCGLSSSSDDEVTCGEAQMYNVQLKIEDRELKDKLLQKYGSHITSLKQEFSKKKKKAKLPKEAREALVEWWNVHVNWPYPTEADKISLAELTGLDQKQINNWFINQRKRHWKPSENMQFAIMNNYPGQFFFFFDR